jgi:phosphohistidine phosphatase
MPAGTQLFVLRHAKSSWDDPGLDDHDRPLSSRGRRAVKLLDAHVRASGIRPALILCSSSRRTQETLQGVVPGGEAVIEPALYRATAADLVERLRQVPDETESVMVIGHNPAAQQLVLRLARPGDGPTSAELELTRTKFPTGALATLTLDVPWSRLADGAAQLTALVRPRDLHQRSRARENP